MDQGKVWLVGAGPGDEELLTVKAEKIIRKADVVVYDALVGKSIISRIPSDTELVFVGKRSGNHTLSQDEINRCLVEYAKKGKLVVRLKGGDPFLFGRGGEEIEQLQKENIAFEVIPGIPSALAVPAYNGIPVTHRDYCSSVHIITGHKKKNEKLDMDFDALCRTKGTLVFLMGVTALEDICSGLISAGMDPQTPAALLSRGTTAQQKKILATVATLQKEVEKTHPDTPAIVVIGKVCGLSEKFTWYEKFPLFGTKVVLTRPRERSKGLAEKLRELGAQVFELPSIATVPIEPNTLLIEKLRHINQYQWLVFTSPAGVDIFFEECYKNQFDIRNLFGVRIAVIGAGTREKVERKGILTDLMPDVYSGGELGRALAARLKPGNRILIARAKAGSQELIQEIESIRDVIIDDVPTYETKYEAINEHVKNEITGGKNVITVFTSSSTVKGYVNSMSGLDFSMVKAACIGEQTKKEADKWSMDTYVAKSASIDSLVELVCELASMEDTV